MFVLENASLTVVELTDRFRVLTAVSDVLCAPERARDVVDRLPESTRDLLRSAVASLADALTPANRADADPHSAVTGDGDPDGGAAGLASMQQVR